MKHFKKRMLTGLTALLSAFLFVGVGCKNEEESREPAPVGTEIVLAKQDAAAFGEVYIPEFTVTPTDSEIQVKVTAPDGKSVTLGENYSFKLEQYGYYTLTVSVDGVVKTCSIVSFDGIAPTITQGIEDKTGVELGVYNQIANDLEGLVAQDNVDGENVSKIVTRYQFADGKIMGVSGNTITLDKVGTYTLYGYVEDNSGNITEFSYKINAVDTVKPVVSAQTEYYAWISGGKVALPSIDISDNSTSVSLQTKVFLGGTEIPVQDGCFVGEAGTYTLKVSATDGYNQSDEQETLLRVLENGVVFDFSSPLDAKKWGTSGSKTYNNGVINFIGSTAGGAIVEDLPLADWSGYGYLTLSLKNNLAKQVQTQIAFNATEENAIIAKELTLGANETKTVNVFFRETEVNVKRIKGLAIAFADAYNVSVSEIKLCNLPKDVFSLNQNEYEVKTYETMQLPEVTCATGFEEFVKNISFEMETVPSVEKNDNGYLFKQEGEYVIHCKVSTKTNEIFTHTINIIVEKGEPQIIIEGLPLGEVGKKSIISRFYLANMDAPTLKVYYTAPTGEKVEISGSLEDGYAFTPTVAGSYIITFAVDGEDGSLEKTDILYVKQKGELISYDSNNGVIEGWPSNNDWGGGLDSINYDPQFVYSGKSSMKYVIPGGREIGTTYQNADIIVGTGGNEDVLSMALYAETSASFQMYMITDSGAAYGYSQEFSLVGGAWTVIYTDLANWFYYGTPANFNIGTNIVGLAFKNVTAKQVTLYVDEVRVYHHSELGLVTMDTSDITVTAYETIALPEYEKTLLFNSAYEYTVDETVYGIRTYLYPVNEPTQKIELTGVKNYFFDADGEYIFEVTYQAFGEEFSLKKKITAQYAQTPKIAVDECKDTFVVNTSYVLPEYQYYIPENITDYEIVIMVSCGNTEWQIDSETRVFTTETSGQYTFRYQVVYGQNTVESSFEAYVRGSNEIINFEKTGDEYDGMSEIQGGVAQTYEITDEWASQGKHSLKVTFDDESLSETSLAGSKARGILYLGEVDKELGTENANEGCNAICLTIKASRAIRVIFDIVFVEGGGNWSKVYSLKEGVNEILIQSGDTLSGKNDFSLTLAQFNINYLCFENNYTTSGDVTIYVDGLAFVYYVENDYVHQAGEFITFEKIGDTYDGVAEIMGGVAQSYEITDEWASQGKRSLMVTFNDEGLTDTSLAGAKARGVLYLGEVDNELGVAGAGDGYNAVKLTIKANKAIKVIFDVMFIEGGGNWSKVYELQEGVNEIIIRSNDTLSGTNDFVNKTLSQLNLNYLCYETDYATSGDVTVYIDGLTFIQA